MNRTMVRDYLMSRNRVNGRNSYGSRGEYSPSRRGGRDRLMMDDMRMYNRGEGNFDLAEMTRQNQEIRHDPYMPRDYARGRMRDYGTGEPYAGVDDFYNRRDGHYPINEGKTYYPIEAMGTFNGYWGRPQEDYGYDMRYDMRMRDHSGDYGETLTYEELERWNKKLMKTTDDASKQFFKKENIEQRARQMGFSMEHFKPEELATASLMIYSDYANDLKPYVGNNMDIYIKMGKSFLTDPDASVKGGEKLAVYHDCIVEGEDD